MTTTPQAQVSEEMVGDALALYTQECGISPRWAMQKVLEYALSAPPARDDVAALVEALEPFAKVKIVETAHDNHPVLEGGDMDEPVFRLTAGDFRRAAQSLARVRKDG